MQCKLGSVECIKANELPVNLLNTNKRVSQKVLLVFAIYATELRISVNK